MPTFKLRPNQTLLIELGKPAGNTSSGSDEPRGVVRARRRPEYFARRKKKSKALVNFYDLDLKLVSGQFVEHAYQVLFTLDMTTTTGFFIDGYENEPSAAQIAALTADFENNIFAEPLENWKNIFKRIEKGSFAEKTIKPSAANSDFSQTVGGNSLDQINEWKDDGLELPFAEVGALTLVADRTLYSDLQIPYAPSQYKITATRDINAPSVFPVLKGKINVFLMPAINNSFHVIEYSNPGNSNRQAKQWTNVFLSSAPRKVLDKIVELYDQSGMTDREVFDKSVYIASQYQNARVPRIDSYTFGGAFPRSFDSYSNIPPAGDWGDLSYLQWDYLTPIGGYPVIFQQYNAMPILKLLAVIESDGNFYYIWRTN